MMASHVVDVINLGRLGFLQAYNMQMRYARKHLDELTMSRPAKAHDTLLLVEHNPVYTVGIRDGEYDLVIRLFHSLKVYFFSLYATGVWFDKSYIRNTVVLELTESARYESWISCYLNVGFVCCTVALFYSAAKFDIS